MQFSLDHKTASLSVGDFAAFALGPHEGGGGPQGLWRAQLGQHWHNELRVQVEREHTIDGVLRPDVHFEVPLEGRLVHRGWTITLAGRIDQLVGPTLREIKTVLRPLPADEADLRADYPEYFRQLATYVVLLKVSTLSSQLSALNSSALRSELVFVEAGSGLAQTIALTPFDEALVHHQLDALVEFLGLQLHARERRQRLQFQPPFTSLREGQETIQADLRAAFGCVEGPTSNDERPIPSPSSLDVKPSVSVPLLSSFDLRPSTAISPPSTSASLPSSFDVRPSTAVPRPSTVLFFEAPTGYGKTGCVLEFALEQLKTGRFTRLIWLTGKSTGQLQVMRTLQTMAGQTALPVWQIRNKAEHCVNHTFHCVRDGCDYLNGCTERWPASGLSRFYLDDSQPRDLETLRAAGRDTHICPYEITRAALAFNDVWVGDYNYVFAPDNRGLLFNQPGFDPRTTLLVIDEAHNLPSRVADAYSHRATDNAVRLLLAELDHLRAPGPLILAVEQWAMLLASLEPAESLEPALEAEIHDLLERLAGLVGTTILDYAALGQAHCETLWNLATLHEWLLAAGPTTTAGDVSKPAMASLLWCPRSGELNFTCTDASAAIGETLGRFGGAIFMSATLQPYENTAAACGLASGHYASLHAPAPWRDHAYDVAVDLRVDTTFKQRASYYDTTAATIEALHASASAQVSSLRSQVSDRSPPASATPCVAVFFPSYAYAEAVLRAMESNHSVLRVALQPKLPDLAAQQAWVEENLALSDALFLVLGSSFAEGIDLLGGRVTHAMVVGPALPEVNAVQKARLGNFAALGREAAFRRVYQIPGLQKVNQALGRLVRAPGQKAKVLLHCRRYADPSYSSLLALEYQFYREIRSEAELHAWLAAESAP